MIENLKFPAVDISYDHLLVSLVVPVLDECNAVPVFVRAIDSALASSWPERHAPRFEIIFVDDGSGDGTAMVVRAMRQNDPRIKLISLSRNFGKEAALSAGLKAASGHAVIPMDVDLQDPPELLRPMIDQWLAGAQVVNARRSDRSTDTLFKRFCAQAFYKTMRKLADHPIASDVGDFRLFDRVAVDALNDLTEHSRFNKGLFSWIGFRTETLEYVRPVRSVGTTKWNFFNLIGLALDGVISSTTFPLRICTAIGAVISLGAFGYASYLAIRTIVLGIETPGYASMMVVMLFLGGINLLSLGLVGEYIGRIAKQVRGRPLYIIADTEGL